MLSAKATYKKSLKFGKACLTDLWTVYTIISVTSIVYHFRSFWELKEKEVNWFYYIHKFSKVLNRIKNIRSNMSKIFGELLDIQNDS